MSVAEWAGELPPRALFPSEMPRYPNLWFLVDAALALRGRYPYAARLLVAALERQLGLRDTFVQDVENRGLAAMLASPGEGSDFQARLFPLEPHRDPDDPALDHDHQVHARFYVSPLMSAGESLRSIPWRGRRRAFFVLPASVHYEVATEDPLHPYADSCPMCGITGGYQVPIDPESQDYSVKIHDPLGLEVLLHGTLRGEPALDGLGRPVRSLEGLDGPWSVEIEELERPDGEPRSLGLVALLAGDRLR